MTTFFWVITILGSLLGGTNRLRWRSYCQRRASGSRGGSGGCSVRGDSVLFGPLILRAFHEEKLR